MNYDTWKTTDPRDADPNDAPFLTPCEHCSSLDCDGSCAGDAPTQRDRAVQRAQELADWTQESYQVFENADGMFRVLRADEWPESSWGRIATVEPQ